MAKAIKSLQIARVVELDSEGNPVWVGKDAVVVQLGDVLDRGDAEIGEQCRRQQQLLVGWVGRGYVLEGSGSICNHTWMLSNCSSSLQDLPTAAGTCLQLQLPSGLPVESAAPTTSRVDRIQTHRSSPMPWHDSMYCILAWNLHPMLHAPLLALPTHPCSIFPTQPSSGCCGTWTSRRGRMAAQCTC